MFKTLVPNEKLRNLIEWLMAVLLAVLLFFFLRAFLLQTAHVVGNSMEPTLNHGDYVLLSKAGYIFSDPMPGDIVAFPYQQNPSEYYIKRVIGCPGDVIDFEDSHFIINGVPLNDGFSDADIISQGDIRYPLTVEDGLYFVLGDNRNGSKDSRYHSVGCVPKAQMLGKVVFRTMPFRLIGPVK